MFKTPLRKNKISDILKQITVNRLTEIKPPECAYSIPAVKEPTAVPQYIEELASDEIVPRAVADRL
jgi:hypothetical protein